MSDGPLALEFPDEPPADALVLLRPWTQSDVPDNVMAFADPTVQRFSWPHLRPYTEADARAFFAAQLDARLRGESVSFALADPSAPGSVIGGVSLYGVDRDQGRAAIGFWLVPQARGRGIATHAVMLLADWAFDVLRIERLELSCAPENAASRRVAERCGFAEEGLLRSHLPFRGNRRDSVLFSLLPGDRH